MKNHYKVIYQKQNGEIFERHRNTIPDTKVGEYSSMGWKVLDIKIYNQYRWYSLATEYYEYKQSKKQDNLYWDLKEWA